VKVEKRWAVLGSDLELNLRLAPYVLCVECVNFVARLQVLDYLFIFPGLVRFETLLIITLYVCITFFSS